MALLVCRKAPEYLKPVRQSVQNREKSSERKKQARGTVMKQPEKAVKSAVRKAIEASVLKTLAWAIREFP